LITAWILITALGAQAPFVEKQVRVEPRACHLPAVRGEYPMNSEWRAVEIKIRCKQ